MTAHSTITDLPVAGTPRFTTLAAHRLWLVDNARALFDFFQVPAFNPAGGFFAPGLPACGAAGEVEVGGD